MSVSVPRDCCPAGGLTYRSEDRAAPGWTVLQACLKAHKFQVTLTTGVWLTLKQARLGLWCRACPSSIEHKLTFLCQRSFSATTARRVTFAGPPGLNLTRTYPGVLERTFRMAEPSRRPTKPMSTSSSVSDLSFEDVRLEEANKVSSNRTGTERSASVGLPAPAAPVRRSESPISAAEQTEGKQAERNEPAIDEISWRGGKQDLELGSWSRFQQVLAKRSMCFAAPPPAGPTITVDSAALRENLATFAGQAASTAGQAANTVSPVESAINVIPIMQGRTLC